MDLSNASLNSITVKQADLITLLDLAVKHGFGHVALWRDVYAGVGPHKAADAVRSRGLGVSSICRAGMFPQRDEFARRRQHDDNRLAIDEAAALSADCLVLVCGGVIGRDLAGARAQIREGIAELAPVATAAGVALAVEPMHPMMAADRSAITSLGEANDLIVSLGLTGTVGIALDAYHVWWDVRVDQEIARAGGGVLGVQVSDWTVPINDQLSSRGMPGDGCIDLDHFMATVAATGYNAAVEIEVLNADNWRRPAYEVAERAALTMTSL